MYSGHKRTHAIKFQSLIAPDGIIINLEGTEKGNRHDSMMFNSSNFNRNLDTYLNINNVKYRFLGDSAYRRSDHLIKCIVGNNLTQSQIDLNKEIYTTRVCVEWGFSKKIQQFSFNNYKKNLKLYLQSVGLYYMVSVILCNCHTYFYGSKTGNYFNCEPPSLEEYLEFQNVLNL